MYLKNLLKQLIKQPLIYFSAILFEILVTANFYIRQQFFLGKGSSDLLLYFTAIPFICTLIIPAICYDFSFYSYKNFLPLKQSKKILSKFISCFIIYAFLLLLIIPGALFVNLFGTIDFGQLFACIFCLLFYGSACISLCILLEEIFFNKIVNFLLCILILLIFNSLHILPNLIPVSSHFSQLLKMLSFAWHFDSSTKGIIDTRDILWLTGITALFLFLAVCIKYYKLGINFKSASKNLKLTLFLSFILVFLFMLNINKYFIRIDISKNQNFSLSEYSKTIIKNVKQPLTITYYRSNKLNQLYPQTKDISDFLSIFASENKRISFIVKDTDKNQDISKMLENYGINARQMRNVKSNSVEFIDVYSAIVLEYAGKSQAIPFSLSVNSLEYEIDSKLLYLLTNKTNIINIIAGNELDLLEDYSYVIPWLTAQGFYCNPINILDPNFEYNLLNSTGPLLVIGDSQIMVQQAQAIEYYLLSKNENALFTVSPFSCSISGDWSLTRNLNTNLVEMLENWGITFTDNIAADISCSQIIMYSQEEQTDYLDQNTVRKEVLNYPLWVSLLPQENAKLGATVFWPVALSLSDIAKPFFITTNHSYLYETQKVYNKPIIETNPFVLQNQSLSDKKFSTNIIAAQINGNLHGLFTDIQGQSKVIAIADSYFLSSLMTGYIGGEYGDYRNFELLTNIMLKLCNQDELANLQEKTGRDTSLYKISDSSSLNTKQKFTYVICFIILPLIIILCGCLICLNQKRKLKLLYSVVS